MVHIALLDECTRLRDLWLPLASSDAAATTNSAEHPTTTANATAPFTAFPTKAADAAASQISSTSFDSTRSTILAAPAESTSVASTTLTITLSSITSCTTLSTTATHATHTPTLSTAPAHTASSPAGAPTGAAYAMHHVPDRPLLS